MNLNGLGLQTRERGAKYNTLEASILFASLLLQF